jgi:hypothetical protein
MSSKLFYWVSSYPFKIYSAIYNTYIIVLGDIIKFSFNVAHTWDLVICWPAFSSGPAGSLAQ